MYETDTKWRREVKRKTKILLYLSRLILYLFFSGIFKRVMGYMGKKGKLEGPASGLISYKRNYHSNFINKSLPTESYRINVTKSFL